MSLPLRPPTLMALSQPRRMVSSSGPQGHSPTTEMRWFGPVGTLPGSLSLTRVGASGAIPGSFHHLRPGLHPASNRHHYRALTGGPDKWASLGPISNGEARGMTVDPSALGSCVSLPGSYWESQSMDLLVFQSYPETKGATTHKERGCEGIPGTPLRMGNRGGLS